MLLLNHRDKKILTESVKKLIGKSELKSLKIVKTKNIKLTEFYGNYYLY